MELDKLRAIGAVLAMPFTLCLSWALWRIGAEFPEHGRAIQGLVGLALCGVFVAAGGTAVGLALRDRARARAFARARAAAAAAGPDDEDDSSVSP